MPFALAGFSFGARVVTRLACDDSADVDRARAEWVMAAGFPTRMGDARYLETCSIPKIFIQSEHDEFGPRPELEALYDTLPAPKQLHWIPSPDHFFAGALDRLEETVRASLVA